MVRAAAAQDVAVLQRESGHDAVLLPEAEEHHAGQMLSGDAIDHAGGQQGEAATGGRRELDSD